jgi:hypothetical protein
MNEHPDNLGIVPRPRRRGVDIVEIIAALAIIGFCLWFAVGFE